MGFIDFGAEIKEIKNHTGAIFTAFTNLRLIFEMLQLVTFKNNWLRRSQCDSSLDYTVDYVVGASRKPFQEKKETLAL